jgi:hypothetical protein
MILLFILSALLVPIIAHGTSTGPWGEIITPDALGELDPEKCDAYFEEIGWCQSEIGQQATATTRAKTNTSPFEIPDYCFHLAQSLGQIYKMCGWDKNGLPTSVAHPAATDLPPEASGIHLSKRGARCPQDYHFLLADKGTYHYFFCCPNANDKLLLPQDYTQPPRCCYKGKSPNCDADAQSIPEVCLPEQEVTDHGGIKGCRYRIKGKDKRNGPPITSLGPDSDFHPTTVQPVTDEPDYPSFYCGLRGCHDGLYEVWIGDACHCVRGPNPKPTPPTLTQVTVHSSVTGFISDIAGRNAHTIDPIPVHSGPHWGPPLQASGTTTQTVIISAKPTTLATVTNGAEPPGTQES